MSYEGLPEELWKLIMQHVPLRERLCVCATVSKTLHRAAVAATGQLNVSLDNFSSEQIECLWQWLDQHGQHITKLGWSGTLGNLPVLSRLPCQNLCQLQLSYGKMQLGPSSSDPGVLQVHTALTQLVLNMCYVIGGRTSLAALSAVPALQHLELSYLQRNDAPQDGEIDLPATVLCCLQHLTLLRVECTEVCLQHISCLRELRHLGLQAAANLTPSTTPGLDQLIALQDLDLCDMTLEPAALQACSTLQRLSLAFVRLGSRSDGMPSLLRLIGRQQQLRQLHLTLPNNVWPPAPSAYTALSASSKLQQLHLHSCNLPARAWQQGVFRAGCQLPQLTSFTGDYTAFNQQDVGVLVSCCPSLRQSTFAIQPGVQLTGLAQLTALEDLDITGGADATSRRSLLALRNLSSLRSLYA